MLLKNALDLSKDIDKQRLDMYDLAKSKGLSDSAVIKMSQQLDRKIIKLQKMMLTHFNSWAGK
ncbi:aspartyl-phosphate phosphatase Spo0E family protein [Ectobacillus funiculus]|uniref:aspartyl-phosphate phosphatase Spo0E family protein n=1 Tax=Ectobacillus funiculus TaxID=137993 RepID=UPI00397E5FD6